MHILNKEKNTHRNAIILAAGAGIRMVPINALVSKALLCVNGEQLIDRQIKQLKDSGINDITVITGFKNDSLSYLEGDGIKLIYNDKYKDRNNLYSLSLAADQITNTYIIPCDIWCRENPFSFAEKTSWYMVSDRIKRNTDVYIDSNGNLVRTKSSAYSKGNKMIGVSYLTGEAAETVRSKLIALSNDPNYYDSFWEETLYQNGKMIVPPKIVKVDEAFEINTYEQLRELDPQSEQLKSDVIAFIAKTFCCKPEDIHNISVLKKGMTNRSFRFSINNGEYIVRVPDEGTDKLVDREQEYKTYQTISGLGICEDPLVIDPLTGYKITRYIQDVRNCNPSSIRDIRACMGKLREFHTLKLQVPYEFDLFGTIDFYESLRSGNMSRYKDYKDTKENVFKLRSFIDRHKCAYQLTHIDAIADNFLFDPHVTGKLSLQLIDWEYAGMQDKHVDIAMFCIYSGLSRKEIDKVIDMYFDKEGCDMTTQAKIYCYIAVCGLLWSNWCEYKQDLGIEFGDYSYNQYRYAKQYYRYAVQLINDIGEKL